MKPSSSGHAPFGGRVRAIAHREGQTHPKPSGVQSPVLIPGVRDWEMCGHSKILFFVIAVGSTGVILQSDGLLAGSEFSVPLVRMVL